MSGTDRPSSGSGATCAWPTTRRSRQPWRDERPRRGRVRARTGGRRRLAPGCREPLVAAPQPGGASMRHCAAAASHSSCAAGPRLPALLALAREVGATQVVWNRLYEPAIVARDTAVKAGLRELGFECESYNASLLHEPWEIRTGQGGPYRVFTPFWRACQRAARCAAGAAARARGDLPGRRGAIAASRSTNSTCCRGFAGTQGLPRPGRPAKTARMRRLEAFCGERARPLRRRPQPPRPAGAVRGCRRTCTSARSARGSAWPRRATRVVDQPAAAKSADSFLRELGWREFAHHLLYHFPHTPDAAARRTLRALSVGARTRRWLDAWQRGRTGYPIVDAGMRELWTTGWMHNRVRMIVASLLTKNLRQPWQEGARWFWDTLVDADLANNTLGWQWTAGCGADAAPVLPHLQPGAAGRALRPGRALRAPLGARTGAAARQVDSPTLGGSCRGPGAGRCCTWTNVPSPDRRASCQPGCCPGSLCDHPGACRTGPRLSPRRADCPKGPARCHDLTVQHAVAGFTYWPGGCATATIRSQSNRRRSPP